MLYHKVEIGRHPSTQRRVRVIRSFGVCDQGLELRNITPVDERCPLSGVMEPGEQPRVFRGRVQCCGRRWPREDGRDIYAGGDTGDGFLQRFIRLDGYGFATKGIHLMKSRGPDMIVAIDPFVFLFEMFLYASQRRQEAPASVVHTFVPVIDMLESDDPGNGLRGSNKVVGDTKSRQSLFKVDVRRHVHEMRRDVTADSVAEDGVGTLQTEEQTKIWIDPNIVTL